MTVRRYRDYSNSFKEPSEENHSVPSKTFELFQKQVADDKTAKDCICVADSLDGIYSKRDRATGGSKSKRYRTSFTHNQLVALENQFKTNMFPSRDEQHGLALQLSLSEIQMKRWFQNRRKKIKETKFRIGLQLSTEHFHRIVNHLSAFTFLCPAADPE